VVSFVAELRGHERLAAEELGRAEEPRRRSKRLDASPAAINLGMICLAMICTRAQSVWLLKLFCYAYRYSLRTA
jgi:hypothetical protein